MKTENTDLSEIRAEIDRIYKDEANSEVVRILLLQIIQADVENRIDWLRDRL